MANIDTGFRVEKLSLDDQVLIVSHPDDPTVGVGYEAPTGSVLIRTTGEIYRKVDIADTDWISVDGINAASVFDTMQEPTGYPNRTDSQLSFNAGTRTFTIEPLLPATSFDFYIKGVKYTVVSPQSIVISDITSTYYIYFDETGTLNASDIFDVALLSSKGYTAAIYWNATAGSATYVADERHGIQMDGATHIYLHDSFGTRFVTGLALSNILADASGDLETSAQLAVDPGYIRDEDVLHHIVNIGGAINTFDLEQLLNPIAQIPVLYRFGSTAEWFVKNADNFPLIYSGTAGYIGTLPPYNQFTGGAWQLTEVATNDFFLVHILATNDINRPIVALQGVATYNTKPASREAMYAELGSFSGLPFQEFIPLGSLIFEANVGYANTPKARIRLTDTGDSYQDWRPITTFISSSWGSGVTDHGNLSGLLDDDHPQYHNDARGDARYYTQTQVNTLIAKSVVHRHNGTVTQTFSALTTLLFGTTVRQDAGYTYSAGGITVTTAGWYEISFDVSYTGSTNNRTVSETVTRVNGVTVAGSNAYGYHRTTAEGFQTATSTIRVLLAANDVITVAGRVFAGAGGGGSVQTVAGACRINIKTV